MPPSLPSRAEHRFVSLALSLSLSICLVGRFVAMLLRRAASGALRVAARGAVHHDLRQRVPLHRRSRACPPLASPLLHALSSSQCPCSC
eukprot:84307-Rhodomonas_salina.1